MALPEIALVAGADRVGILAATGAGAVAGLRRRGQRYGGRSSDGERGDGNEVQQTHDGPPHE
jgi:hypothetical protein